MSNLLALGVTAIKRDLEGFDGTLEERVTLAMEKAWGDATFYTGDENEKMQAAVGAVLLSLEEGSAERIRIEESLNMLRDLNAMMAGVPVDAKAITDKYRAIDTLPLPKMWTEVKNRCDPLAGRTR